MPDTPLQIALKLRERFQAQPRYLCWILCSMHNLRAAHADLLPQEAQVVLGVIQHEVLRHTDLRGASLGRREDLSYLAGSPQGVKLRMAFMDDVLIPTLRGEPAWCIALRRAVRPIRNLWA